MPSLFRISLLAGPFGNAKSNMTIMIPKADLMVLLRAVLVEGFGPSEVGMPWTNAPAMASTIFVPDRMPEKMQAAKAIDATEKTIKLLVIV